MGLKKFISNKTKLKQMEKAEKTAEERDRLIQYISERSSLYGDKLLDFMETYGLTGLQNATVEQLQEYIVTHAKQLDDAEITK